MAQGRSTKIISMIKWIPTSRLSMNNSLSLGGGGVEEDGDGAQGLIHEQNEFFFWQCSEVYRTNYSISPVKNMLCGKLRCQEVFDSILSS